MTRLFISHSSADRDRAVALKTALSAQGLESVFLDVDPEDGIIAGADWERTLYSELRACEAVVFLNSPNSLNSPWCFAELVIARFLNRAVFPVMLEGKQQHPLLGAEQFVDASTGIGAAVRPLVEGLTRQGIDQTVSWNRLRVPYPGLAPFEEEDAGVFEGRDEETRTLLEWLPPQASTAIAVVGPSGSGKSSLVRAGLLPLLRRRSTWVILPAITPGRPPQPRPTSALALGIAQEFGTLGRPMTDQDIAHRLSAGQQGLLELTEELVHLSPEAAAVLLFVDQAEELVHHPDQNDFLGMLYGAIQPGSPLSIVATARSELVTAALQPPGVARPVIRSLPVGPLDAALLASVIRRPAERAGFPLTDELVQRMVHDTGGGDALPLLAYTLRRLYDLYPPATRQRPITVAEYEYIGGVEDALRRRADAAADRLTDSVRPLLFTTLSRLATVEGSGPFLRRRVPRATLSDNEQQIIDAFVAERLVTTVGEGAQAAVEVAHEALFRTWEPLRSELEKRRGTLRLRAQVDRLAADWEMDDEPGGQLLSGERLDAVLGWDWQREFSEAGQRFIRASIDARDEQQRQAGMRADAQRLAARVEETLRVEPLQAAFLAARSLSLELSVPPGEVSTEVAGALRWAVRSARERQRSTSESALLSLALSPDGGLIATGALDGSVQMWSGLGQPIGSPVHVHGGEVVSVAVGEGGLLVSGGDDGELFIHDPRADPAGRGVPAHPRGLTAVALVPDGSLIATGGKDGELGLWSRDGARRREPVAAHQGPVSSIVLGARGADLATGGLDGYLRFWDGQGQLVDAVRAHHEGVTAVASGVGGVVATGGADGTVKIWRGSAEPITVEAHRSAVLGLSFSPDGRTLASIADAAEVRLWTSDGRGADDPLVGHRREVRAVAFYPDGEMLASVSLDRTLRLWARRGLALAAPFRAHGSDVNAVAVAPEGDGIVSAGADGMLRRFDLRGNQIGPTWEGHRGFVFALAISSDGATIVSGGQDGLVHLWDSSGYVLRPPLTGGSDQINAIAVHPSRPLLVTGCRDGTAATYTFESSARELSPAHHGAVWAVAMSPDGEYMVTAGDNGVITMWTPDGARLHSAAPHEASVHSVAISPDGDFVMSGAADGTIRLMDRHGSFIGEPIQAHEASVEAIAFDPLGEFTVTASQDGIVQVRSREGAAVGPPCVGNEGAVWAVALSADGGTMVSGAESGTVRIWVGGRWSDNARILCERLRTHPEVRNPQSDLAREFVAMCARRPWIGHQAQRT